jgi:hypothetical protein
MDCVEKINCNACRTPTEWGQGRLLGMEVRRNMDRECEGCRKPFKPIRLNQKFCSSRCARKVRFARYVQRKAEQQLGSAVELKSPFHRTRA